MLVRARFGVRWPVWVRYLGALALLGLALLGRQLLPAEPGFAYVTYYPAVTLGALFFGIGPGVVLALTGALAGASVATSTGWSLSTEAGTELAAIAFLASALLVAWLISTMQSYADRALQSRAALEASESRLTQVVEDQSDMIVRVGSDGQLRFVNTAFCQLLNRPRDQLIGKPWTSLPVPEDLALISDALASLTPVTPVVRVENRLRRPDGSVRYVEFVNHGFFDRAGRLAEVQSVGRDVTERKELEQRLRELAATTQDLYDSAPCGYHSIASDGSFLQVNATELGWLGVSREEAIGKLRITDFLTPASLDVFRESMPRFLERGAIEDLELEIVGRQGTHRVVQVSASTVWNEAGGFVMSRSVLFDVTERRRLEQERRERAREQQALVDSDLVGIAKISRRTVVWSNRGLERIFGYDKDELAGRGTRPLYRDEQQYTEAALHAAKPLRSGTPFRTQLEMRRKDGAAVWIDLLVVPLAGPEESICLFSDVTRMREQHESIRRLAQRLETVREEERRKIAHTLHEGIAQQLFAARLGLAAILPHAADSPSLRHAHDDLQELLESAIRALRTLTDSIRPAGLDQVPLGDILRWYAGQFAERTQIAVTVAEPEPRPRLDAAQRLEFFRAAQELLSNVARHAGARNARLVLRTLPEGGAQLLVADDGSGMEPTDERKRDALGLLGLRERIAALGGKVTVDGRSGGTAVAVTLPALSASPASGTSA